VGLVPLEDSEEAEEARLAFLTHARNRKTSVTTALEYACADGRVLEYSSTSASEKIVCLSSNGRMADADAVTTLAPPQILALRPRTQSDVKMLTVSKAISWSVKTRLYVSKTR